MKFTERSEKSISRYIGLVLTLCLTFVLFFQAEPLNFWIDYVGNHVGDLQLRSWSKPLSKESPVVIVYIDDKSLNEEGWGWPWSRKLFAALTDKLQNLNASVIAFDMIFPEYEENIGSQVAQKIENNPQLPQSALQKLKNEESRFDYNSLFAQSLEKGREVMGIIFTKEGGAQGILPDPSLTLPKDIAQQLQLIEMKNYIANIPILQEAAKYGGFINGFPDSDGIYRFSPLMIRDGEKVYFSLALQAVALFLPTERISLEMSQYREEKILEAIRLNDKEIFVTPQGQILIPYRSSGSKFTSYSAADILNDQLPPNALSNKIVFIGFSASSLGDLVATPIKPLIPGVDIHASIAAGILDGYLPYKPVWGKGVAIALILLLGTFSSLLLPKLGSISSTITTASIIGVLYFINRLVWDRWGIILPMFFPLLVVVIIYTIDLLSGYFFETKRYRMVRKIFSQYVPPEYVDILCEKELGFGLKGENKELTVLFSNILDFPTIAEQLSPAEIKDYLNRFLTPMTELIFAHKGTLDKYIGDVIMAFWGAPLEDPEAPLHAVTVALSMQKKLEEINCSLKIINRPEIKIGIGVNTGAMYVGDMGSEFKRAYTVIGDAVNLASRLEGLAKVYGVGVIVGEKTYSLTSDTFYFRKLDKVRVKGKMNLVEIYQPLCLKAQATQMLQDEVNWHTRALELYLQKSYDLAKIEFQKLRDSYPDSRAFYEGYLIRIEESQVAVKT